MKKNLNSKEKTNRLNTKHRRYDQNYLKYRALIHMYAHSLKKNQKNMNKQGLRLNQCLKQSSERRKGSFSFSLGGFLGTFLIKTVSNVMLMPLLGSMDILMMFLRAAKNIGVNGKWDSLISNPITHGVLLTNRYFLERVLVELDREDNFFVQAIKFLVLDIGKEDVINYIKQDCFYYKNRLPDEIADMFNQGAPKNYNPELISDSELKGNSFTKYSARVRDLSN